jgi:hypothetical protein
LEVAYRVDAERHGLAGGLLTGDAFDVDLVLQSVDTGDLALAALRAASYYLHLIVLSENQSVMVSRVDNLAFLESWGCDG